MQRLGVLGGVVALSLLAIALSASPASATVLCKTATNPCTGGTYGKGTTIEASLKSLTRSVLHPEIGDIECASSSIKGEVTNAGGEGAIVSGPITSLTFGSCNTEEIEVLKKGTFTIESTSEGNGTLKLEGLETTVKLFSLHCIFSGPVSIPLKGGEMASIGATATMTRTGGRSGVFCGGTSEWTAEYTVTAPAPLWVERP